MPEVTAWTLKRRLGKDGEAEVEEISSDLKLMGGLAAAHFTSAVGYADDASGAA